MNLLFIRHIRRNFTAKIILSVSLLIVIASIAITVAYIRVQGNTLRDKLLHEGELLSQMLAYTSRLAVFS
ncbi:MAG TPA: hypothetical protein VFR01_08795, partial [Geobacterales bacterium]|nr:hypothetical protein [Geobacterales bacterium]